LPSAKSNAPVSDPASRTIWAVSAPLFRTVNVRVAEVPTVPKSVGRESLPHSLQSLTTSSALPIMISTPPTSSMGPAIQTMNPGAPAGTPPKAPSTFWAPWAAIMIPNRTRVIPRTSGAKVRSRSSIETSNAAGGRFPWGC